jgi:hypothetical protein
MFTQTHIAYPIPAPALPGAAALLLILSRL